MSSFEVVCMSNSPLGHLERFVAHYRTLGAARVLIFYDGEILPSALDCEIVLCNEVFWLPLGENRSVEDKQRYVYDLAYRTATHAWILVVDVDELVLGDRRLDEYLASVDVQIDMVRFISAEAIFSSGDDIGSDFGATSFRLPYPSCFSIPFSHVLYPGLGQVFIRGLLGHSRGKYAVRTGYPDISVNIHEATRAGTMFPEVNATTGRRDGRFFLAHFDAISFAHWQEKWRRRLLKNDTREMGAKRDRQMELFQVYDAKGCSEALFRRLYGVGGMKLLLMKALRLAFSRKPAC